MPDQPGDKIYQRLNFSQIRRELTIDKLWQSRTWGEIFKHMLTALVLSAIPTFYDVFTDGFTAKSFIQGTNYTKHVKNLSDPAFHQNCIHVGRFTTFQPEPVIEYEEISCFEKDPIWGILTVFLIFWPGIQFACNVDCVLSEAGVKKSNAFLLSILWLPTFPVVLLLVKLVGLINPGPEWKKMNIRLTSIEGDVESSFQLLLTFFVIFTRADRTPSGWQVASLIASIVMVTKTAIAEHLSEKQMSTKEELKATESLLLVFLSNGAFKILSLAIIIALLKYWGLTLILVFSVAVQRCVFCRTEWKHLRGAENHLTRLVMVYDEDLLKTDKHRMANCVFNNIFWICVHTLVLTGLIITANCYPEAYVYNLNDLISYISNSTAPSNVSAVAPLSNNADHESFSESVFNTLHSLDDGYKLNSRALAQNLPLLNWLYVGILCTMVLHCVLFYFQMWKPFKEKEEEKEDEKREDEQEHRIPGVRISTMVPKVTQVLPSDCVDCTF